MFVSNSIQQGLSVKVIATQVKDVSHTLLLYILYISLSITNTYYLLLNLLHDESDNIYYKSGI